MGGYGRDRSGERCSLSIKGAVGDILDSAESLPSRVSRKAGRRSSFEDGGALGPGGAYGAHHGGSQLLSSSESAMSPGVYNRHGGGGYDSGETRGGGRSRRDSGTYASLLLGALPVLSKLVFGGSHKWIELSVALMVTVWIYYILQTPWTLFLTSKKIRYDRSERFFILMLFASPLVGAYSLHMAKSYFGGESAILASFSIPLFLIAAMLRPALFFLQECGEPIDAESELHRLRYQIGILIDRIDQLEGSLASIETASKGGELHAPLTSRGCLGLSAEGLPLKELTEAIDGRVKQKLSAFADRVNRRIVQVELSLSELQGGKRASSSRPLPLRVIYSAADAVTFPYRCAFSLFGALFNLQRSGHGVSGAAVHHEQHAM